MLGDTISGNTKATFKWTQGGAGGSNVLAANTFVDSGVISLVDCEQIGIAVQVISPAGTQFTFRLKFSTDASSWIPEQVEALGAVVAGAQRYTPQIKEWGPVTGVADPGTLFVIERPTCFHFALFSVNALAAVAAADTVIIQVERQRGAQLQPQSGA